MLGVTDTEARGELALVLYERLGDLDGAGKASNNLGGIAYFDGRWDDAVEVVPQCARRVPAMR